MCEERGSWIGLPLSELLVIRGGAPLEKRVPLLSPESRHNKRSRAFLCGMGVCREGRSEGALGAWGVLRDFAWPRGCCAPLLLGLHLGLHFPFVWLYYRSLRE